jgi:ParB family transcriptional regulator, chromosome partitioning protein
VAEGSSGWPTGSQPRGIGRGLAAILPRGHSSVEGLRELPLDLVRPNPDQPRREFDGEALLALAESIKARGLLQPIVARGLAGGSYELLAGERRVRAARLAGLESVPAILRQAEESERLELALIENMAREELNPVDSARACATLVEDLGVTKEELGRRLGRSRVAISNLIRLLDLPEEALDLIASGELTEGHGRAILTAKDQAHRRRLARDAASKGWSVRETERRARNEAPAGRPEVSPGASPMQLHPDLADAVGAAEDALTAALGREVRVRPRGDGFRVELELEDPRDGIELAERILRRAAA